MASRTPATEWADRLSQMTRLPSAKAGQSNAFTEANNNGPVIAPAVTIGATSPAWRNANTRVEVCP
jgi:hypothetical protein